MPYVETGLHARRADTRWLAVTSQEGERDVTSTLTLECRRCAGSGCGQHGSVAMDRRRAGCGPVHGSQRLRCQSHAARLPPQPTEDRQQVQDGHGNRAEDYAKSDGDYHIYLNMGGTKLLVSEAICAHSTSDPPAVAACKGYTNTIQIPAVGARVVITAPYCYDTIPGWYETASDCQLSDHGRARPKPSATRHQHPGYCLRTTTRTW